MKEATSAHDLRGLHLVSDLYILMGLGMIVAGLFFLWTINLSGVMFMGLGLLLGVVGYYLDELKPWAWWGAFLGNLGSGGVIGFTIAGSTLQITLSLFYYLVEASLTIAIFLYLLQPWVRELFFVRENM